MSLTTTTGSAPGEFPGMSVRVPGLAAAVGHRRNADPLDLRRGTALPDLAASRRHGTGRDR